MNDMRLKCALIISFKFLKNNYIQDKFTAANVTQHGTEYLGGNTRHLTCSTHHSWAWRSVCACAEGGVRQRHKWKQAFSGKARNQ